MKRKKLRRGFTTGTCAAAGSKAAALSLFGAGSAGKKTVDVTLPSGKTIKIKVKSIKTSGNRARAVIIKDAGDDPDVTNGAEIISEVEYRGGNKKRPSVTIRGGEGVGVVTKPGLKIPPGRPAINPVPLKMIRKAVLEAAEQAGVTPSVEVTISVPKGRVLAKNTMNPRLGIVGGISILGTSGIVEPMSLKAYTHSISCGVDVAMAQGCKEVVFSTGRSSEKVVEKFLKFPETAFILTGDHMGFAIKDSAERELKRITIAGQFGKFTKLASNHFETHCEDSSVEFGFLAGLCKKYGADEGLIKRVEAANTAREVFYLLKDNGLPGILKKVCRMVKKNASSLLKSQCKVRAILVGYDNDIVCVC